MKFIPAASSCAIVTLIAGAGIADAPPKIKSFLADAPSGREASAPRSSPFIAFSKAFAVAFSGFLLGELVTLAGAAPAFSA
jgi:hypothetical protein